MVRQATLEDIPWLLVEIEKFFNANTWPVEMEFSPQHLKATLNFLINDPMGVILRDEHGVIGGLCYPHYFTGVLTAQEFFWWAPKGGKELWNGFEDWAKSTGAKTISMITLEGLRPDGVGKLYKRKGYSPVEHSYIKAI